MNKSDEVLYALRGVEPAYDLTNVLIKDGDWVIRCMTIGQSSHLFFARCFPKDELSEKQKNQQWGTRSNKLKVTVFTDHAGHITMSTVTRSSSVWVIDESLVPASSRALLAGSREEIADRRMGKAA